MANDKTALLDKHYQNNSEYDQLVCFLHTNMGDALLPLLEKAEAEGKRLFYDEEKVPAGMLDYFDADLVSLV